METKNYWIMPNLRESELYIVQAPHSNVGIVESREDYSRATCIETRTLKYTAESLMWVQFVRTIFQYLL